MLDRSLIQKILYGVATDAELAGADPNEVLAVKRDQSEPHFRFVMNPVAVETTVRAPGEEAEGEKRYRHIASDESKDAVGDRILVKGWELARFEKNPQLLWAHDQRGLPIGSVARVWKGRTNGQPALLTESTFHKADENPQAPLVERLVAKGALPGVSVGFVPKKMVSPESEEQRAKMGLGPWGVLHEKSELLELSVVPVPANSNALRVKMVEAAKPLLRLAREEGEDPELIELVERTFNLSEQDERQLRRRWIVVPDIEAALAPVVKAIEEEAASLPLDPEPESKAAPPKTKTVPTLMRLDADSMEAIRGLTEALVNKNTPEGGTDAESATEVAGDPPVPADPGGDFLTRAAALAAEKLGSS